MDIEPRKEMRAFVAVLLPYIMVHIVVLQSALLYNACITGWLGTRGQHSLSVCSFNIGSPYILLRL